MVLPFLATVYPDGALVIFSALLWLLFSALAFMALVVCSFGIVSRNPHTWVLRSLKFALWTSVLAFCTLVIETMAVGWDVLFVLDDSDLFFKQFPANLIRAAVNLVSGLLSLIAWKCNR